MTIKKTNLKYFFLPLLSAIFIVSLIIIILFTFGNDNNVFIDAKLANNIDDFNTLNVVNTLSFEMYTDLGDYTPSYTDVYKDSDGYIYGMIVYFQRL